MKTVKDYLDFGLVFVDDDMIQAVTGEPSYGSTSLARCLFKCGEYPSGIKLVGSMCGMGEWIPSSFAWRNNDGVKPEYKGLIHAMFENGVIIQDFAKSLNWGSSFNPVIQWRPTVFKSGDAKKEMQEKFLSALYSDSLASKNVWSAIREQFCLPVGIDSPELREAFKSLRERLENKPPFWNKLMPSFNCPCVAVNVETSKLTVSPKEDKTMKPVYTAEMHAKWELPPIGAECEALCMDQTKSKHVWTKAQILMHHEGNECAVYCIDAGVLRWADEFKPIIKTIKVNGFDVPAPMSEAPEDGVEYFIPSLRNNEFVDCHNWHGDSYDELWLSRCQCHQTESAAIAHAKAMLGIDPND